jgi:hypothetical protein
MRFNRTSAARVFVCAAVLAVLAYQAPATLDRVAKRSGVEATLEATTYTYVLVHGTTWGTDDVWKLYAYDGANGSGNLLDGPRTFNYSQMQPYWDASIGKYRVPLTVFANTTPGAIVSVTDKHINFTVGRSEWPVEILD